MKRYFPTHNSLWAFCAVLWMLLIQACILARPAIQESEVTGVYTAVTDFSRDVQNMNGDRETRIYKNGREEKLKFLSGHRFVKTIHYSSDRVADQIVIGEWELADRQLIHAFGKEPAGAFSEYYQMEGAARNLIRLDEHKQKLAPEYALYYTYYRQTAAKLGTGSK